MSPSVATAIDWYDTPLYYDIIFEEETEREGAFLEAVQERHGTTRGRRAFEPACGSGRLLLELARRGYQVLGMDENPRMLEFARERRRAHGSSYRLRKARMEEFSISGNHDLAHCLVSTFKYVLTEEGARSHLECVARGLKPGGLYVLGLHLADYDCRSCSRERWVGVRDGIRVTSNLQTWPAERRTRLERVRVRLRVEERGEPVRHLETNWRFRTYDERELDRLFRAVPDLVHVATYDFNYDLERPIPLDGYRLDVVVVLRKR